MRFEEEVDQRVEALERRERLRRAGILTEEEHATLVAAASTSAGD